MSVPRKDMVEHLLRLGQRCQQAIRWLAKNRVVEGIAPLDRDLHEVACDVAQEWGREEANDDDYQEALLRIVEASKQIEEAGDA